MLCRIGRAVSINVSATEESVDDVIDRSLSHMKELDSGRQLRHTKETYPVVPTDTFVKDRKDQNLQ